MDSISAIYSKICLHPITITELHENLPYSRESIYKSIQELYSLGLIEKVNQGRTNLIIPSKGYRSKLMQDLFIKALENDVDPKFLLEDSFITVLKNSKGPTSLSKLRHRTGLSYHRSRKVLFFMEHWNLIRIVKRKPLLFEINEENELISIVVKVIGSRKLNENDFRKKMLHDGDMGFRFK